MKKLALTFVLFNILIHCAFTQTVNINIKVYLEGSYDGIEMTNGMNNTGLLPLMQPYNSEPWNYEGTENVTSIPNEDIVDWVLVELRETTGGASTAIADSMISRKAAFLLKDGSIVDLDGENPIYFDNEITNNLYVVVYHRNHLPIMSSSPLTEISGGYSWDFTTPEGQAFGTDAQKNLSTVYGMIGGDSDANGIIDMNDKDLDWANEAGNTGYYPSDLNMDTEVNNPDKNDIWETNLGDESQLPIPLIFICGDQLNDIDGNTYNTVQIGAQCWMKENLKTTKYNDGNNIPHVTDNSAWTALTTPGYCYYLNDEATYGATYGALYNWYTVNTSNLYPTGWHVPTDGEWTLLSDFLGGTTIAGGKMKESGIVHWNSPNTDATNSSNFSGLPGGARGYDGPFYDIGNFGHWWSSTGNLSFNSWSRNLGHNYGELIVGNNYHENAISVRCLRD